MCVFLLETSGRKLAGSASSLRGQSCRVKRRVRLGGAAACAGLSPLALGDGVLHKTLWDTLTGSLRSASPGPGSAAGGFLGGSVDSGLPRSPCPGERCEGDEDAGSVLRDCILSTSRSCIEPSGLVASRQTVKRAAACAHAPRRTPDPWEGTWGRLHGQPVRISCVPNFLFYSNLGNKEKWPLGSEPNRRCILVRDLVRKNSHLRVFGWWQ